MAIVDANYAEMNFEEMAAAIGLKPKHMPMLIASFIDESGPILSDLESAIGAQDFPTIKLKAHSIKGSAGNLKFNAIYEMAREMEFAGQDSNADFNYTAYLDAIKKAIATIPQ